MEIVELDRAELNKFVGSAFDPQILQTYEWGEVKALSGWKPLRLAVKEKDKIIAAAAILQRKLPYINRSIFYIPRGPISDLKRSEIFEFLLKAIKTEAKKRGVILLKIDPEIDENDVELLKSYGFWPQKKQVQPRATIFIDLKQGADKILKNCEEKTRYNIRLSIKKGVKVEERSDAAGVQIFYDLYKVTARRDEFLIHPKKYYDAIEQQLNQKGMGRIFVAYYENQPVAAVWIFCLGKRIWYMYGASNNDFRNVMPNHALHWEVIQWAIREGYELYDLWGIPANPGPDHPLFGVYRFKKGFNGELRKFIGAMDLVYDPILYWFFEKALTWYKNLRSLLTKGRIEDSLGE